ncbi:MAG: hypothetical protein WCR46_05015 [Deltaproteobacteria bacterium]
MTAFEITSGTDLVAYADATDNQTPFSNISVYPIAFHRGKPEEYDSEFEFAEKKKKPHHVRKKKGWER